MTVVGMDIGGANLKLSDGTKSISVSFPLWQAPEKLGGTLRRLLAEFDGATAYAVTMTGELADCFETRAVGVERILRSVSESVGGLPVAVWQTGGEFFTVEEAHELPELVAAANWHALATWAGRATPDRTAILIDIGSTTTDLIPIEYGIPMTQGSTDLDRLQSGELVYSGVRRTPLFAISKSVEIRGRKTPLAAELFATTVDVTLLSGDCMENSASLETANSRPLTVPESRNRIARAVCSDCDQLSNEEIDNVVQQIRQAQIASVSEALERVIDRMESVPQTVILSGEGEFLAKLVLLHSFPQLTNCEFLSIENMLGEKHSEVACAYALSVLGRERIEI